MFNRLIILFVLLSLQYAYSQNISGGCGPPITPMIPSGIPVYGTANGQYYATKTDYSSPKNVLSDGIWCASYNVRNNSFLVNTAIATYTCSSADWNGTTASASNGCGVSYSDRFSVGSSMGSLPFHFQFYVPNNLCEKVNATTGGLFFTESFGWSSTFTGRSRVARNYPSNVGTVLASFIISSVTKIANVPYVACSKSYYWVQRTGFIESYTFTPPSTITQTTQYSGFTILSYYDDLSEIMVVRNSTHLLIATLNQTAMVIYDASPIIGCTPTAGSEMNTDTGYLYTVCYEGNSANTTALSAIYQINMTTWTFIRSKIATYQWNYRATFAGCFKQIMYASGSSTFTEPRMYCIKDPYNPVYISNVIFDPSVVAPSRSSAYRIAADLGQSSCFEHNYFSVQQQSTSQFPVYLEFCGSCTFDNSTFCNNDSPCCTSECLVNTSAIECLPETTCLYASNCTGGTCPAQLPKPSDTVCGAVNSTCYTGDYCNGFNDTCVIGMVTGCPNATDCLFASTCINGTCDAQIAKPDYTICGTVNSTCYTGDFCNGFNDTCVIGINTTQECLPGTLCLFESNCTGGVCPAQLPKPADTICVNETSCIYNSTCNGFNDTCPTPIPKAADTVCGTTNSTCYTGDFCNGYNDTCVIGINTTQECLPGTSCLYASNCTGGVCPAQVEVTNGTLCGPMPTDCTSAFLCYSGTCINGTLAPDGTPCVNMSFPTDECFASQATCEGGSCSNITLLPPGSSCGTAPMPTLCLTNQTCNATGVCLPSDPKPVDTPCSLNTIPGLCDIIGNCVLDTTDNATNVTIPKGPPPPDMFPTNTATFGVLALLAVPVLGLIIIGVLAGSASGGDFIYFPVEDKDDDDDDDEEEKEKKKTKPIKL